MGQGTTRTNLPLSAAIQGASKTTSRLAVRSRRITPPIYGSRTGPRYKIAETAV